MGIIYYKWSNQNSGSKTNSKMKDDKEEEVSTAGSSSGYKTMV